jgi:hypothetical protein
MLFDLEAGAARRLARYRLNPAVVHISSGAAAEADKMVVMSWLARDVGVRSIWEVNPLHQPLFAEELQESKDGRTPDPHPSPTGILHEVSGGEMPLAAFNERGELSAWAGQAHPCAIQCVEHLFCHDRSLAQMIPSLNTQPQSP